MPKMVSAVRKRKLNMDNYFCASDSAVVYLADHYLIIWE